MDDSRVAMSRWLLLVASVLLWVSVAIALFGGAGFPWIQTVLALLATAMAAVVWTRFR
jgi:hypothetical protein